MGSGRIGEFLERLLEDEVERAASTSSSTCASGGPASTPQKTMDNFDFNFNPSINRQQILELAAGDYIRTPPQYRAVRTQRRGKTAPNKLHP